MKFTLNILIKFFSLILVACSMQPNCSNDSSSNKTKSNTTLSSDTIQINISGATANGFIGLTVINEITKGKVSDFTFKIKPDGEKADDTGNYSKTITGLIAGNSYSIMVLSDANENKIADTNDTGQLITGISTGSTKVFDSFKTLSTLSATVNNDTSLASKIPVCMISSFDYSSNDINNMANVSSLGIIVLIYDASGNASPNPVYLPIGSYNNILCVIDTNSDNIVNTGDKYQIISGPTVLTDGDDSKTFSIGDWTTL